MRTRKILLCRFPRYSSSALAITVATLAPSTIVLQAATTGQVITTRSPIHTAYSSILPTSAHRMETIAATAILSVALPA